VGRVGGERAKELRWRDMEDGEMGEGRIWSGEWNREGERRDL
jgi:hypothetical protein